MSVLFFVDFFLFASECAAADKGAACQPFLCAVRKCTRRGVREGDQYRSYQETQAALRISTS